MRKALRLLPVLLLIIFSSSARAQSTTFTPKCLDSATTASVQTTLSTFGSALGLAGGTTTDISNNILQRWDAICTQQAQVAAIQASDSSAAIAALQTNISTLNTQIIAMQSQLNNLQAAIQNLATGSTSGGTTGGGTGTTTGGGSTTPPAAPTTGNVIVNAGGAPQAGCQQGSTSVVPAGTTGTIVAGPKVIGTTTCVNVSFATTTFNGWTPNANLTAH